MTGADLRLRVVPSEDVEPELMADLTAMCEAAFEESFEAAWDRIGPGIHVVGFDGSRLVAHAMVIDRRIWLGHEPDQAMDVGYVEHVATWPDVQGRGHGTAVMREINRLITEDYALGALATRSRGFYERLGWETWLGPTYVRMLDGQRIRSAEEDGQVMVLRTPRTPADIDITGAIAVDWRPEEPW